MPFLFRVRITEVYKVFGEDGNYDGKDFRKKYLERNCWETFDWKKLKSDAINSGSKFFDNWTDIDHIGIKDLRKSIAMATENIYYCYADYGFYGFPKSKQPHRFCVPLIKEDGVYADIFSVYSNENIDTSLLDSSEYFEDGMIMIWKNVVEDVIKSLPKAAG